MPGIFKKLNAQDVKITPFEAHKQYDTTNLASIGAQTASLAWSGKNKSTFTDGNRKYYQIDKLYYRNYIQERAYRLELDDATYTTQERRLYESASVLSLSQKTFGSEVQPETFELGIRTGGGEDLNIKDDGFGNLYDTFVGKDNFPNEDNRVFYLSPVQGFKRKDLTIDPSNGSLYVNNPYSNGFNGTFFDDSYFQNKITYENIIFTSSTYTGFTSIAPNKYGHIKIAHTPILNFENNESFSITFNYEPTSRDWNISKTLKKQNILSKEGHRIVPTVPSETTQYISLSSSQQFIPEPVGPQFPYRLFYKGSTPNVGTASLFFERSDGEVTQFTSASFFRSESLGPINVLATYDSSTGDLGLKVQGGDLGAVSGLSRLQNSPKLTKSPTNKADIYVYKKAQADGSFTDLMQTGAGHINQLMFFNKKLSDTEHANVSKSIVGTPNIGNIFYDNGFAVLTHPKYMGLFNGSNPLTNLKYKNTHLITENEYQCTVNEEEFEFTNNLSAREAPQELGGLASFATGSNFKPYITTVGLHDDNGNLLVVGKLGQPIKASSETDTTFVIRFDT